MLDEEEEGRGRRRRRGRWFGVVGERKKDGGGWTVGKDLFIQRGQVWHPEACGDAEQRRRACCSLSERADCALKSGPLPIWAPRAKETLY
jgi:hypothetical protein